MKLIGPKSYTDVLKIFDEENKFKDGWYSPEQKDTWPRGRFDEANAQFNGEWYEYELSSADMLNIKLPWNKEFMIPEKGMAVQEALQLPLVKAWIAGGDCPNYPRSTHVWLASKILLITSAQEYKLMKNHDRHLINLDGVHRLLVWAHLNLTISAFIAGRPSNEEPPKS
jgi:hypothetical protein